MLILRSALFWVVFAVSIVLYTPVALLARPLPFARRFHLVAQWARFNLWWLRVSCRLDYTVEGREHITPGSAIIFCKHQSAWETLALQEVFPPQVWVLKRELLWVPFFGWGLAVLEPIAIDRKAGRRAVSRLVHQGVARLAAGRWVVVFPEGTRVAPGAKGKYHVGGAMLAERSGHPVVPVAHNAGLYWPRRGFIKRPGTIRMVIGPPIPTAGRKATDILAEAEAWIEAESTRLLEGTPSQ